MFFLTTICPREKPILTLAKFSLAPDRTELIPILKEILAINPKIQILGSPWSPPAWMKTNNDPKGGKLKTEYYAAYANYFVKYIQGMKAEGITIDAITIQNEPLNDKNTPSMLMQAEEQAQFIRDHLGPAFKAAGIRTKIILYDHNCDVPEYALSILNDPQANPYVDGSGFHLYGGEIGAMSAVHNAFPQKNLYFTEFMAAEPTESARISISKPVVGTFIGALAELEPQRACYGILPRILNLNRIPTTEDAAFVRAPSRSTATKSLGTWRTTRWRTFRNLCGQDRSGSLPALPQHFPNVAFKTLRGQDRINRGE